MNANFTYTENGANQLRTSGDRLLDFFAEVGSARTLARKEPQVLQDMFANAIAQDPKKAMSIMFWARAVRVGAGQRDVFDALFGFAYKNFPKFIENNLGVIADFGYFKDYVRIADKFPELENAVADIFVNEIRKENHLAAKWLPRRTRLWRLVQSRLETTNGDFRKLIAKLSNCVEQKICAKKISEIDYSKIPSKAFNMYRAMFMAQDRERFVQSIVNDKINTAAIYPNEIFDLYYNAGELKITPNDVKQIVNAQWKNLKNFIPQEMRFLTVLDTSGSMTWGAARIANPLSVYCAENLEGDFKNKVISFSADARFFDLSDLNGAVDKVEYLALNTINENTNLVSVFRLILNTAIENGIPNDKMPNCLLILSDMQFDAGAEYNITLIDKIKLDYKYAGYDFPAVIYWNLESTNTGIVDDKKSNVAFVSGFNPKIMESVFGGMEYEVAIAPESDNAPDNAMKSLKINPLAVMEKALAPIETKLNFENLANLPESFAKYDYNYTRGYSFRMRSRKNSSQHPSPEKCDNLAIALSKSKI